MRWRVFILDLLRDPLDDLMATPALISRHPALALNWYPPGFYFRRGRFRALRSARRFAHSTAVLLVRSAAGLWSTGVRAGTPDGLLATALFIAYPEWNHWARSVMLEAPAIALLVPAGTFECYL